MTARSIDWTVPGILGGLAAVMFVMAAACGGFYRHLVGRVERVEAWPTTEAVVVVNKTELVDGRDLNTGKWQKVTRWTIEYTYEVDGRSYTSKNINVEGTSVKFEHADHPVGSRMPVRYDPADPSIVGIKAAIDPAMKGHGLLYLGMGMAALGLLLASLAARSWLRQRSAKEIVFNPDALRASEPPSPSDA